eukprot:CAMPEP_0184972638 /NCGR_PEP_ID=MMETSP1098-20130426/4593_1 /TAXON_ID=89044 /ORGANISM="Spumella elongata, Strain CCAP 955/1" /LENGTH=1110 /DNA_ID=CAMNT_0027494975 /DNA_START=97 /DNA_END=3429 /DNA_ORIENTATION=-
MSESRSPTAAAAQPVSSLVSGLTSFSSLLTSAIGSIDNNVSNLQTSTSTNHEQIEALKSVVERYGRKLADLELEADLQRDKLENALMNVTDMSRSIDTQLTDATKQMQRQLLTQRTATKMDLFALQGTMRKSMNEALELIQESPKLLNASNTNTYSSSATNEDNILVLLEKLRVLEEAMKIQHTVNVQLTESVNNDEVVRKVYDSLFDQITTLEGSLNTANAQNLELREKHGRDLKKMRDQQKVQQDQISQLIGALLSPQNMKKFKQTMSRVAEGTDEGHHSHGRGHRQPVAAREVEGIEEMKEAPLEEEGEGSNGEEEEEGEDDKEYRSKKAHKARRTGSGSDEEDGFDEHNNRGPRSQHRIRKHHHHVTRHGVVHRSDTTPASPKRAAPVFVPLEGESASAKAGREAAAEVAMAEKESTSGRVRRHTELKRQKTFNSTVSEEKETQTAVPSAATVSTNTDPAAAAPSAPSVPSTSAGGTRPGTGPNTRPVTPKTAVVFDDENSLEKGQSGPPVSEINCTNTKDDVESLDGTYSYYDSDSYYSTSIIGGVTIEQLEKVAADAKHMVDQVRQECSKRTDEIEESMQTFKRIAFMLEDMKINYELLKAKVDALNAPTASPAGNYDDQKSTAQYNSIQQARNLWTRVHAELLYGLEKFTENESDMDDELTSAKESKVSKDSKLFAKKAASLVAYLDSHLTDFHPAENIAQTLKTVHPTLESIYRQAVELDALDESIRAIGPAADSENCQFDKLPCSDGPGKMKQYVQEAMAASVPVLDESIPKVAMRARLEALEKQLLLKTDKTALKTLQDEMRTIAKAKVDLEEFRQANSKMATTAELAKLNLYVADIGGRGSAAGYNNASSAAALNIEQAELAKNPDFQSLLTRFDMLGKQQLDLHNFCGSFVPREEVHEAMKAVIGEVKSLKQNTVNHTLFKDGLKTKADITEVERIVKTITSAVGDLNINSADSSAAIHAKCLICDKPVTSTGRARTALSSNGLPKNRSSSMVNSTTMPLLGYSKAMDDSHINQAQLQHHENTMFNRLTSKDPNVSQQERVKVATELAIMRSSIEPLPDINDSTSNMDSPHANSQHYKNRIRHSAGGGVGPNYKKDTR